MSLKHTYTVLSPLYDLIVDRPTRVTRARNLQRLQQWRPDRVLLEGIGSGLDIPYLPRDTYYVGTDLTPAMLHRARQRARAAGLNMAFDVADARALPYDDETFDVVVLHLIVAVVGSDAVLAEASRVLRGGGHLLIFDKFLRPGQRAPVRRAMSKLLRHVATHTDVVIEDQLATRPELSIEEDEPALAGGWFRSLVVRKCDG